MATHVPYKGGAPAVRDLVGGQVDMGFIVIGGVHPHLQSGKLTALASSGKDRSPELPSVPTLSEAGYPGLEITYAYFATLPKGPSEQVRRYWQDAFREMLARPPVLGRSSGSREASEAQSALRRAAGTHHNHRRTAEVYSA